MKIFQVDVNHANSIAIDDEKVFIVYKDKAFKILPSNCPHRGGPLQYSSKSDTGELMICPWHKNKFKPCALNKKMPPLVQFRNTINILTSKESEVKAWYDRNIITFN